MPASRWLSATGNALFFGALGGAAFFGYYTLRYSTPEMAQLIDERKQPEHDFPGSQVGLQSRSSQRQVVRRLTLPPSFTAACGENRVSLLAV